MMSVCQEFQMIFKKSKNDVSHYYEFESNLFWLKWLVWSLLHERKCGLRTSLPVFVSVDSVRINHSDYDSDTPSLIPLMFLFRTSIHGIINNLGKKFY